MLFKLGILVKPPGLAETPAAADLQIALWVASEPLQADVVDKSPPVDLWD